MKQIKRFLLMSFLFLATLVLTACHSSQKELEQLQGAWSGRISGAEVELIVSDDRFTMDGTFEVSGLFTTTEVSERMMSGTIDTRAKTFVVTEANDIFDTSYYDDEEDEDEDDEGYDRGSTSDVEGSKLTYKLSGNTLILTDDSGEVMAFKK